MIESDQAYASPAAGPGYGASAQTGDDRVRERLAPDVAAAIERARGWLAASQGRWRPATTMLSVTGIGAQAFADWFIGLVKGADEQGMRAGHPEHFLTHPRVQAPLKIIETVGQDRGP